MATPFGLTMTRKERMPTPLCLFAHSGSSTLRDIYNFIKLCRYEWTQIEDQPEDQPEDLAHVMDPDPRIKSEDDKKEGRG